MGPIHESKVAETSSHVMSMGMPKQGHICDTENLLHQVASL